MLARIAHELYWIGRCVARADDTQTHAWLEALVPDGESGPRSVGLDPTNRRMAGETHVKIGHGRSYQDVAPIRGVYRGPATSEHTAAVQMRRLNGEGG